MRFGYKFTKKKHPEKGIMSASLGLISTVSVCLTVYLTFCNRGIAAPQYGCVVFLSLVFAIAGIVLGIMAVIQKDIYRFFPVTGLLFNGVALFMCFSLLYLGVTGI